MISQGAVNAKDRLIVALDFDSGRDALDLVRTLDGAATFFKVGYELFVSEGPAIVRELIDAGNRVFLDLKMNDVDETIIRSVRKVAQYGGVEFLTIYGTAATVAAAVKGKGDSPLKLLQVTLLTSMGPKDLEEMLLLGPDKRFQTVDEYVLWRAEEALARGCHGLISSGENVAMLRERFGTDPVLVCPGIRPGGTGTDEHKRATTPGKAICAGADYLVIGRPIRDAAEPRTQARAIVEEIEAALEAKSI